MGWKMNNKLIFIIGVIFFLLIPFIGCVDRLAETKDNKPSISIVGLWKRESDNFHVQYHINGTHQIFTEYDNFTKSDFYSYSYKDNILTKYYDSVSYSIWDIEWLDSDMFNETSRDTGSINVFKRVSSLPI